MLEIYVIIAIIFFIIGILWARHYAKNQEFFNVNDYEDVIGLFFMVIIGSAAWPLTLGFICLFVIFRLFMLAIGGQVSKMKNSNKPQ